MKYIGKILGGFGIIILLSVIIGYSLGRNKNYDNVSEETSQFVTEKIFIKSDFNVILPEDIDELIEKSELVVRCSVKSVDEVKFVNYVSDDVLNLLKSDGALEYEYSHIWTYCTLNIKDVYKGECGKNIKYRYLGGKLDNYIQESPHALKVGGEYILFLQNIEDEGIYSNAIDPSTVVDVENGYIKNDVIDQFVDEKVETIEKMKEVVKKNHKQGEVYNEK